MPGPDVKSGKFPKFGDCKMFSVSDRRPASLRGSLSADAASRKPHHGDSHAAFAERGMPWAVPYIDNAEPVRPDAPDIMAGKYTEADMTRMLDADMQRRRQRFQNFKDVMEAKCDIPRA